VRRPYVQFCSRLNIFHFLHREHHMTGVRGRAIEGSAFATVRKRRAEGKTLKALAKS
jgi:hypothetical protein